MTSLKNIDGRLMYLPNNDEKSAVFVDFENLRLLHRIKDGAKDQELSRAVGLKKQRNLKILDATAGFGKDAFFLASLGCEVRLLERDPIMFRLLEDGFIRARKSSCRRVVECIERMSLHEGDFLHTNLQNGIWDTVYLDPMFPKAKKSALVKKDMQVLQTLLLDDDSSEQMIMHALRYAISRVVVKRRKSSPLLSEYLPDIQYSGSSNRFDVYLSCAK
jgi:16S rRNA (guanine1516-N2)-methyltransferase